MQGLNGIKAKEDGLYLWMIPSINDQSNPLSCLSLVTLRFERRRRREIERTTESSVTTLMLSS